MAGTEERGTFSLSIPNSLSSSAVIAVVYHFARLQPEACKDYRFHVQTIYLHLPLRYWEQMDGSFRDI